MILGILDSQMQNKATRHDVQKLTQNELTT